MALQKIFHAFADSMVLAEANALKLCIQAGANDCNTAIWVHNGYMSIAVDISWPNPQDRPWGTGWGPTQADAEYWATQGCKSHGGTNCTPTTWNTNPQQSAQGGSDLTPPTPPVPIPGPTPTPPGAPPPPVLTAEQQAHLRDLLDEANNVGKAVSCAMYIGNNLYEILLWANQIALGLGYGVGLPPPSGQLPSIYTGQCESLDREHLQVVERIEWPISDALLGTPLTPPVVLFPLL